MSNANWTPVSKMLPGNDRPVFATVVKRNTKKRTVCIAKFHKRGPRHQAPDEWEIVGEDLRSVFYTVLAWQEVPPVYLD